MTDDDYVYNILLLCACLLIVYMLYYGIRKMSVNERVHFLSNSFVEDLSKHAYIKLSLLKSSLLGINSRFERGRSDFLKKGALCYQWKVYTYGV